LSTKSSGSISVGSVVGDDNVVSVGRSGWFVSNNKVNINVEGIRSRVVSSTANNEKAEGEAGLHFLNLAGSFPGRRRLIKPING